MRWWSRFGRAGWDIPPPSASMFALGAAAGEIPRRRQRCSSRRCWWKNPAWWFRPGVAFGEHGEGYVRIAMVENEQRIRQAARGVRRFLESGTETLHNVVPLATRRASSSRKV